MSRIPPGQKRDRMTVDSGMALDANDERYDVTAWRKALYEDSTQSLQNQDTIIANQEAMLDNQTSGNAVVGIVDENGTRAKVDNMGQLHVVLDGMPDDLNSSEALLDADEVFTGEAVDISPFAAIVLMIYSDQSSANNGVSVQYSYDALDWHTLESYNYIAGAYKVFTPPAFGNYYRVTYNNGAVAQTVFHMHVMLKKTPIKWSSHNINDPIKDEDDAELVKAVITGKNANGQYGNVSLTNGGNMKVSLEELESGISDDSNSALKVSPYLVDEFGATGRMLSDNLFLGAPVTIASEHHEIHCGDSYVACRIADVGNGATDAILIVVPNASGTYPDQNHKTWHLQIEGVSESEGEWRLYESPTYSALGTAINSSNRNRNSTNVDYLSVYYTPTVSVAGTLLECLHVGSGKGIGGEARSDEWVLKNNTVYYATFVNFTTSANHITWRLNYYVHPGQ